MNPGAYRKCVDVEGRFEVLAKRLGDETVLAIADARVLALHPQVARTLARKNVTLVSLKAGEGAKSLTIVERLTKQALTFSRKGTVLAIGGGTIGDVATVFAHVFKRGVGRLVHVPTTLLAAVDSSVGGKGAVNVAGTKNVLGVFHAAEEGWLCPELFTTLSESQRREGRIEAWKMVVTLDAKRFAAWSRKPPTDDELVRVSRALKHSIVAKDPYETKGLREVLNFGHTLGHAIESLSRYRVRHGEAVGLGMLYALDVGVREGVTPRDVAQAVEEALPLAKGARKQLASWLAAKNVKALEQHVRADKKGGMILLTRPGRWVKHPFLPLPRGGQSPLGRRRWGQQGRGEG
jgi:3-dehydroquinate synthase